MSHNGKELYEFSDFRLDIPERILARKGKRVTLSDKAFETLCVLVRQAGHLVTKDDLMSKVWPDTIVEENSLDKSVSALRQVLGDRKGKGKFIETIRGHGYRFVAGVRLLDSSEAEAVQPVASGGSDGSVEALSRPDETGESETVAQVPSNTRKVLVRSSVVFLAVIIAALAWKMIGSGGRELPLEKIESLAVLPLINLSGDTAQEYFADGMTEELIARLGRIRSLRVISRTSVMEYKGVRKSVPEIAKELNVDAILEASVLQAENRVRITAQLIHAATDRHLWSESYERDLTDILALQNEVASAIAEQVQVTLVPEESAQFENAPPVNPAAYEAYLRGLNYARGLVTEDNVRLAAQMFQKAVDLDPGFASAQAQLAKAESFLYFTFDRNQEHLSKSRAALDKAFELRPGFAEGHLAQAYYYYWGYRDYERALQEFAIAERMIPNNKSILTGQGAVLRRQGKWENALTAFQKAQSVDPRDPAIAYDIGFTSVYVRKYTEAEKAFDLCISLGPDEENCYMGKALIPVYWKGDAAGSLKILNSAPDKKNSNLIEQKFLMEFRNRAYDNALEVLSSPYTYPNDKPVYAGLAYLALGNPKLATDSFETARTQLENELKIRPDDYSLHGLLGITYAGLGRKADAIREGQKSVDLLPVSKDAVWGTIPIQTLALIYTLVGEQDLAIEQLEYLLSFPSQVSVPLLRIDPRWDPLRSHPRFQRLMQEEFPKGS